MLLFAGLAVDVGGWYARAAVIQRAADAAALAGVARLSEGDAAAVSEAIAVARRNGFVNGVGGVTVTASRITGQQRVEVIIRDANVPQYITQMVRNNVTVTRRATAEQVLPVPLGSPRNFLGTALLMGATIAENFWLALSGTCASKEQGERITAISDANFSTTGNPPSGASFVNCNPGSGSVISNTEYSANGYFYAVDVPPGFTGNLDIQVYDGAYCSGGSIVPGAVTANDRAGGFTTSYTVRSNDSLNPINATALTTVSLAAGSYANSGSSTCSSTQSAPSGVGAGRNCSTATNYGACWQTLATLTSPTPGTYYIQVRAAVPANLSTATQQGTNEFAIRTMRNGIFTACSADPTSANPTYSATCPNVHGLTHLGVDASLPPSSSPSFFLAAVGPEHNNKVLEITLWDSGEGAAAIQVLNPLGNPEMFTWQVLCQNGSLPPCSGETAPTGGYGPASTNTLDVSGTGPQPGFNRLSASRYNDRLVRLTIQLPTNIQTAYSGATWWRIRYTTAGTPTDRTTWSVIIRGDPVRLVPNS